MTLKKRIFEIVEVASEGDRASRIFDIFITTLISLNVLAVILETIEGFSRYSFQFRIFEIFSVLAFSVEYALRIWTCTLNPRFDSPIRGRIRFIMTPMAIIDLLAILPFYIPRIIPVDLRFMRVLRLFRLFRLFKMARYSQSLKTLGNVVNAKKEELGITLFFGLIMLIFSSSVMYYAEHDVQPKVFSSILSTMWWGVATLTTVGYGDIYPVTTLGKFFGGIMAILGIGMFALPTGILASGFAEEIQKSKTCPHCGMEI